MSFLFNGTKHIAALLAMSSLTPAQAELSSESIAFLHLIDGPRNEDELLCMAGLPEHIRNETQTYAELKESSGSFGSSSGDGPVSPTTEATTPNPSQVSSRDKRSDVPQPHLRSLRPSSCGTEDLPKSGSNLSPAMMSEMIAMISRQVATMLQPQLSFMGAEFRLQQESSSSSSSSTSDCIS